MANFEPKKLDLDDINGGIRFTESDGVTPNAINDPIEAVAYSQTVVEHLTDTPDTSEINGAGSPNVSFVSSTTADGVTIHKFKFSNLSGATFTPSLDKAGNLSWSNNRNLPNPPTINISGRDYLFSSEVLSGTSIPQVNSEVTDIPLTSFNRAPVDDIDHCYLFYYYTPENIYYWLATQVVDIQKTTATLKILSVVRLTGYTPTIGKNGNWFIGGDDTGKPSYGASGVTDVVAGASYNQDDFTVTPLTFNFEVGNSKTVNVKAAIGNVEDGSYAKLAQVVRVDTAQSLTDAQKQQAQKNIELQGSATLTAPAWYKIASVSVGYVAKIIRVKLTSDWGADRPFSAEAIIAIAANSYSETTITTVGNFGHPSAGQNNTFSQIRLNGTNIEVYYNTSNSHACAFEIEKYDHNNANITIYDFETTSQDEVSGSCFVCDFVNGINTSGKVYQQGSPVLVGDQSSIFESNGTTVKNATNATNATKATQDADGNVINATYAKLSQVVRVDAAQQLTDTQKMNFSKNSRLRLRKKIERSSQWKTVAHISGYGQVCMAIATDLPGQGQLITKFFLAIGYMDAANITQIGHTGNSPVSAIRLRSTTNTQTYIDLLFNEKTTIATTVSVYFEANLNDNFGDANVELIDFENFSGNEGDYTITTLNLNNSGISTTGTIYQQGSPVLVGYASSESGTTGTSGGLALPSAGWYYIRYTFTSIFAVDYATGVFYWGGDRELLLPVSYYYLANTSRCVSIGSSGVIKIYDADTGEELSGAQITYYKLA